MRRIGRDAERLRAAVRRFADEGHGDVKALRGVPGGWLRLRVGQRRIVLRRRADAIEVARIVDRRDLERTVEHLRG